MGCWIWIRSGGYGWGQWWQIWIYGYADMAYFLEESVRFRNWGYYTFYQLFKACSNNLGHGCVFWGTFDNKREIFLLAPSIQVPFWIILNENVFSKLRAGKYK